MRGVDPKYQPGQISSFDSLVENVLLIWRYSPLWALAPLITAFQLSLSCAFFHQAVTFKVLRSCNTSSSHLSFYNLLAGRRLVSCRTNFPPSFWYALATSVCLFLLIELCLFLWIIYIIHHYILFSILHLHSLGHRSSIEFFFKKCSVYLHLHWWVSNSHYHKVQPVLYILHLVSFLRSLISVNSATRNNIYFP
jgi:hypothetical protein